MKYAILGGSFDPVHKGHLGVALTVMPLGYERIILVPAYQSPFKPARQGETAKIRLLMLLSAISGDRRFTVDACEVQREGISYTIDTLRDIQDRYQFDHKPALILGDDIAATFPCWKDAKLIMREVDIIIASRLSEAQVRYPYPCTFLGNMIMELSSCSVRDTIQDGGDWKTLVPNGVRRIIEEYGLYGADKVKFNSTDECAVGNNGGPGDTSISICDIENAARGMMDPYRFIHSRNVALHSADLARRFGLDADSAYIAGITHDMCKEFDDDKMTEYALKDGGTLSALERDKPSLLHGRAAAMMIQERFGINDGAVIEAVRLHTTGGPNMGPLAKIVYIADKIEAARTTVDPRLRRIAFGSEGEALSLDALFRIVFDATLEWLFENRLGVSEETLKLRSGIVHEETN
ncbi:MAG: nicotinate (nicotinamide) nucleotide adenylyltransferase [Spirochaetaceae bacterium]|nr:nicotinate (nicotinamide) nucleotide adenylyltransferase [Spirochaetaceae bacterium]